MMMMCERRREIHRRATRRLTTDDDVGKGPEAFHNKFHTDNFTPVITLYIRSLQSYTDCLGQSPEWKTKL